MPLVCATVGLEAAGGLALAGVAAGRDAGREAAEERAGVEDREGARDGVGAELDREGAEARVDVVAAGGFGGLGAAGAFASLAGTAGPCRCGLAEAGLAALGLVRRPALGVGLPPLPSF